MDILKEALAWASYGHAVLPLHGVAQDGRCTCGKIDCAAPAKHPYTPFAAKGAHSATTEEHVIRDWFELRPRLNYGVTTDRLFIADIDPRNGGNRSWNELRTRVEIPKTWRAKTGGSGWHVIFARPAGVMSGAKPLDGIDLKCGAGAYVVGVGSLHISGNRYTWAAHPHEVALELPPQELIEALTDAPRKGARTIEHYRGIAANRLENGSRNERLARLAAHLYNALIDPDDDLILDLMQGWNLGRGNPPLEPDEVEHIVSGIAMRELKKRGLVT